MTIMQAGTRDITPALTIQFGWISRICIYLFLNSAKQSYWLALQFGMAAMQPGMPNMQHGLATLRPIQRQLGTIDWHIHRLRMHLHTPKVKLLSVFSNLILFSFHSVYPLLICVFLLQGSATCQSCQGAAPRDLREMNSNLRNLAAPASDCTALIRFSL